MMNIDPSILKIWHAWIKWNYDLPYWDPYGAAVSLVIVGFAAGYVMWKVLYTK